MKRRNGRKSAETIDRVFTTVAHSKHLNSGKVEKSLSSAKYNPKGQPWLKKTFVIKPVVDILSRKENEQRVKHEAKIQMNNN